MGVALIVAAVLLIWLVLLGAKVLSIFGLVVACAMFSFPVGLIGLVATGVALLFLLAPRHRAE